MSSCILVFLALSTLAVDASPTSLRGSIAPNKSVASELAGAIASAKANKSNRLRKNLEDAPSAVMVTMLPPAWTRYGENYTSCTLHIQQGSFSYICLPDQYSDLTRNGGHTSCLLADYDMFVRLHIGKLCSEMSAEIVASERLMATVPTPTWLKYGKNYTRCTLTIQLGSASFICLPDRFSDLAQNGQTECQLADYSMFVRLHIGMQCSAMPAGSTRAEALTEDEQLTGADALVRNSVLLGHHNMTAQVGFSELSNVTSRMGAHAP
eukprot:TRINITY_DN3057_c0_g1_i1.p1 TRINITY_DN3057_c0_g1~~TRINITY_DN3057_c0_g1_i1.p1  ORF type:complete len:266 (+),score=27.14 TRINITY_DN3057_c0_g1_i1:67-864(+)